MRLIKDLGEWFDHRLQVGQQIKRIDATSGASTHTPVGPMFLAAPPHGVILTVRHGHLPRFRFTSLRRPGPGQSLQVLNHQQALRLVHSRPAWLGLQFPWCARSDSHVQVFLFGAYVSTRPDNTMSKLSDLPLPDDPGDWRHGQCCALTRMHLGARHRCLLEGPSTPDRNPAGSRDARRARSLPVKRYPDFLSIHVLSFQAACWPSGFACADVLKLELTERPMPARSSTLRPISRISRIHTKTVALHPGCLPQDFVSPAHHSCPGRLRCALGPFGPTGQPDPTIVQTVLGQISSFSLDRGAALLPHEYGDDRVAGRTGYWHRFPDRLAAHLRHRGQILRRRPVRSPGPRCYHHLFSGG